MHGLGAAGYEQIIVPLPEAELIADDAAESGMEEAEVIAAHTLKGYPVLRGKGREDTVGSFING